MVKYKMSCLFDSLSKFVADENVNGATLRHIICNYLATNPNLIDDMNGESVIHAETGLKFGDYISRMRLAHTFGGAIEIRAFTKIFKLNVVVKSYPNNKLIEFVENKDYLWAAISWTGNHFEALESLN